MATDARKTSQEVEREVRSRFEEMLGEEPRRHYAATLTAAWIDTPVGTMLAAADDTHLRLLSFLQLSVMERKAEIVQDSIGARLEMGENPILQSVADEMAAYFDGVLRDFKTPLILDGTSFQLAVWGELRRVPFGMTVSYADLAGRIGKPAAFRAVAQANAQNPIVVMVPCHRVINSDGRMGGYSAGQDRKRWLLDFEREVLEDN